MKKIIRDEGIYGKWWVKCGNGNGGRKITLVPLFGWYYGVRPRLARVKSEQWIKIADAAVPLLAVGLAAVANLGAEFWDLVQNISPNNEFGNDVAWGVAAAGVVGMRFLLSALNKLAIEYRNEKMEAGGKTT